MTAAARAHSRVRNERWQNSREAFGKDVGSLSLARQAAGRGKSSERRKECSKEHVDLGWSGVARPLSRLGRTVHVGEYLEMIFWRAALFITVVPSCLRYLR